MFEKPWLAVFIVTCALGLAQWCRRRVCKRTIKSFDLLKIRAKSLNILTKSLKILAKMPPNAV